MYYDHLAGLRGKEARNNRFSANAMLKPFYSVIMTSKYLSEQYLTSTDLVTFPTTSHISCSF